MIALFFLLQNVLIQKILYIGNIVDILLCGNLHHYYCILPYLYIQKGLANHQVKPPNYSQLGIRAFYRQNSFLPSSLCSRPSLYFLYMDSTAAADFSLSTGSAAQPASPPQAAVAGALSSPQQPPPVELVSDSSS